ncbi:MAG: hypothetical protein ABIT10_07605 [Alteraurantiacibacter sp.]
MHLIQEIVSPTGKRKLHLYRRKDGRYQFEETYEDFDEYAGHYWTPGYQSGVYDSEDAALAEMRALTPWLRAKG